MTILSDVIIVGGGAIGAACARELALAGRKVLVLDRPDEAGEAWRAAAGMLAPQIEATQDDPLFEFGLAGRERYHEIAPILRDTTGIDIGLWQGGIARLAISEEDAGTLKSRVAWQRQQGHLCDWFDEVEVQTRWPWLGPSCGALWAPREGALDSVKLVEALLADARRAGATLRRELVIGLDRRGDRIVGVIGTERYAADHVILAAGAWSGRLEGLPRPVSVEPVRGQMAALPWPAGAERAIIYGGDVYLVERGGEALAGSTMEYAGFNAEVTSAGLARIFAGATALCPALATAEVKRTWAGLRPMTPDGRPIVGKEPSVEGLWYATGHGRSGILLAAITGLVIKQLICGESTVEEHESFRPERFWSW